MQVDEILVWRAWLVIHQTEFDRFDYNVRLGAGVDPGPTVPEPYRTMAIQIRQKRVDAVGYTAGSPTLFEVKRRAGPENLGQLLVYARLWPQQFPASPPPALVLVASDADPHTTDTLAAYNVRLDLVPTVNFSVLAPGRIIPPPQV